MRARGRGKKAASAVGRGERRRNREEAWEGEDEQNECAPCSLHELNARVDRPHGSLLAAEDGGRQAE